RRLPKSGPFPTQACTAPWRKRRGAACWSGAAAAAATKRGAAMAYSLIDGGECGGGAVPLVAMSKDGLAAWRERAPAHEREWIAALGFAAEPGKIAPVPGPDGR